MNRRLKIKIGLYVLIIFSVLAVVSMLIPTPITPIEPVYYTPIDFTGVRFAVDNDESVDADSNVDAVANIGTNNATYIDAQTLNGVYQGIVEAQGAGYVAATDTNDYGDNITDTQSPTNIGTYSNSGLDMDSAPDATDETLTEVDAGGASLAIENEYSGTGKKVTTVTFSSVVVPSGTGRAIYLVQGASTKNIDDGKFITNIEFQAVGGDQSFTNFGQGQLGKASVEIWYLLDPDAETADVLITYIDNNANWNGYSIGISVLSGVDTAGTPHDTWETPDSGTGAAASHTIATATGDYCLDVIGAIGTATTLTENGDGVEIFNLGQTAQQGASADLTAISSTCSMAWTVGSPDTWIHGGISINPAGGANYRFDREVGFTSVDFDDTGGEELAIFTGTIGTESLQVYVWSSGSWNLLVTIVDANDDTWINTSISAYLTTASFSVSFRDATIASDSTLNTWNIDSVLIHTWNDVINDYELDWEHQATTLPAYSADNTYALTIYGKYTGGGSETIDVQMWNTSDSGWDVVDVVTISTTDQWYNATIVCGAEDPTGVCDTTMTWRFYDSDQALDSTQDELSIDYSGVYIYSLSVTDTSDDPVNVTAIPNGADTQFNQFPFTVTVDAGQDFDLEIKCADVNVTACANGWIYFDVDATPSGYTQLLTTYQNIYTAEPKATTVLNVYLWANIPIGQIKQTHEITISFLITLA